MAEKEVTTLQILTGWKEIANYLRKGVRSVQRYERDLALPIHRLPGKSTGSVIAIKAELDSWVTAGPIQSIPKRRTLNHQTYRIRADFLLIDSEVALTFAGLALTAKDPERKRRAGETARKAYKTIMRLRNDVDLLDADRDNLNANLQRLKSELQSLGQKF